MKVLLVLPPTAEKPAYAEPPLGLLYVGGALRKAGAEVAIIDIYRNYISPEQLLEIVRDNGYDVVGFGGITTCYGYVKEASKLIRAALPSASLIAGGVLSSASEILLNNAPIDVICMGEGEVTTVKVVERLSEGRREFDDIMGVSFLRDGEIVKTHRQEYIRDLDEIPIPDYDLIDMDTYAFNAMEDPFFSADESSRELYRSGMRCFNLKTARGCTNACSFCYRHFYGHRQQSVGYVIEHIRYLQEKYNIHFFRFGDELFTRSKEWVMDFTRRLLSEKINIRYVVHGVRTDNVDKELIENLRESGCIAVFIGFESGSDKILKVMRKNVTVEQNIQAVRTILDSGIQVLVQTVIGLPGEDGATIKETTESLKQSGIAPEWVAINYAQAYPGTWIWKYAIKNRLVLDPEKYLIEIGKSDNLLFNYTDCSEAELRSWRWSILRSLLRHRAAATGSLLDRLQALHPKVYSLVSTYKKEGAEGVLAKVRNRLFPGSA
jgi:anaerobic magnesium-protoporphyrin IX monomethyl ester cyclase